jgi:hypothetical protein
MQAQVAQVFTRLLRLTDALPSQIDVSPAGEKILQVPDALSMSTQNQLACH